MPLEWEQVVFNAIILPFTGELPTIRQRKHQLLLHLIVLKFKFLSLSKAFQNWKGYMEKDIPLGIDLEITTIKEVVLKLSFHLNSNEEINLSSWQPLSYTSNYFDQIKISLAFSNQGLLSLWCRLKIWILMTYFGLAWTSG